MKRNTYLMLLIASIVLTVPMNNNASASAEESHSDPSMMPALLGKTAVKLYPNPTSNGKISVVSTTEENLHFYVFDLEGTLMHQVVLKGKSKHSIKDLQKGVYVYDVFKNDISIEQGKIVAK